jgi:hypothetical protein
MDMERALGKLKTTMEELFVAFQGNIMRACFRIMKNQSIHLSSQ